MQPQFLALVLFGVQERLGRAVIQSVSSGPQGHISSTDTSLKLVIEWLQFSNKHSIYTMSILTVSTIRPFVKPQFII